MAYSSSFISLQKNTEVLTTWVNHGK